MKTSQQIKEKRVPGVRFDSALDKYEDVIMFPEKLAKANERLKRSGPPRLPKK